MHVECVGNGSGSLPWHRATPIRPRMLQHNTSSALNLLLLPTFVAHPEEILHLVLETLTAALKAAPDAAAQWEPHISGALAGACGRSRACRAHLPARCCWEWLLTGRRRFGSPRHVAAARTAPPPSLAPQSRR